MSSRDGAQPETTAILRTAHTLARRLDKMELGGLDDEQEVAFGDLGKPLGGWSTKGFAADLQAKLDSIKDGILAETPLAWRHPSDPDVSPREVEVLAGVLDAQERFAREWVTAVEAMIAGERVAA